MTTAIVLERPTIEDTLFGEAREVDLQAKVGPGPEGCFCICGCRTGNVKIPNSDNVTVDMAIYP